MEKEVPQFTPEQEIMNHRALISVVKTLAITVPMLELKLRLSMEIGEKPDASLMSKAIIKAAAKVLLEESDAKGNDFAEADPDLPRAMKWVIETF